MLNKKTASLLSLCRRAGKLVYGETNCEKAFQSGEARLVIISADASANTKKRFLGKAHYYKTPSLEYGVKEELGRITGSGLTSSIVITDDNFSSMIQKAVLAEGRSAFGSAGPPIDEQ